MKKVLGLMIIQAVLCLGQTRGDTPPGALTFVVDSIAIAGNKITEEYIITRELTFSAGDTVTPVDLNYNRERVFSLGIFNRVDIYPLVADSTNTVMVDVEESWYIYPLPFAELKDKSWDKVSYGFDIYVKNFRGRNESVRLRAGFGYDPSLYLNYTAPSLTDDGNYYFFADLNYRKFRNKSRYALQIAGSNFDQKYFGGLIGLGRRFGLFHRLSLNAGYSYIENPFYIPGISASGGRIDRFPQAGLNYIYDTRDLVQFPADGIYFNTSISFKGFGLEDINYQVLNVDFREYRQLFGDIYGKWRLSGRFGFGELIPTHDYSYLGFAERIRGFYSTEMEGHHYYIGSAEIYYPVFRDIMVNLDFIPLLPKELLHYRAGLYVQLFTDAGTTKFRKEEISVRDFVSGYGIGITLLVLPYNIFRTEFAIGENGLTEWIVDIGISF